MGLLAEKVGVILQYNFRNDPEFSFFINVFFLFSFHFFFFFVIKIFFLNLTIPSPESEIDKWSSNLLLLCCVHFCPKYGLNSTVDWTLKPSVEAILKEGWLLQLMQSVNSWPNRQKKQTLFVYYLHSYYCPQLCCHYHNVTCAIQSDILKEAVNFELNHSFNLRK